jgi:chemotaxis protein CheZ
MPDPRKVFRVEQVTAPRQQLATAEHRARPQAPPQAPPHVQILSELAAVRALLTGAPPRPASAAAMPAGDIGELASALRQIRAAFAAADGDGAGDNGSAASPAAEVRIASELEAVLTASEQATLKILGAAEDIDQAANNLSAALKAELEQGLAQDIRDRVVQIFEACNYQDLTSQRVAKVMAALERIEQQLGRMTDELTRMTTPPMHGPSLPDDRGHLSQAEIDAMLRDDLRPFS